jgi:hypothetical protein
MGFAEVEGEDGFVGRELLAPRGEGKLGGFQGVRDIEAGSELELG